MHFVAVEDTVKHHLCVCKYPSLHAHWCELVAIGFSSSVSSFEILYKQVVPKQKKPLAWTTETSIDDTSSSILIIWEQAVFYLFPEVKQAAV